jgi:hypothetical protein
LTRFSENPKKSLKARVARLEARAAALEAKVAGMQEEIDRASGAAPAGFLDAMDAATKKRPDPRQKVHDTELLLNRDNLTTWLEEHWPKIAKFLLAAKSPVDVAAVLTPIAAAPDIRSTWQRQVMDHPAVLLEFLRSEKFRRKPPKKTVVDALDLHRSVRRDRAANRLPTRQIANAMAGVPKLKCRTSLDKCSKRPSSSSLGHKTATYYRAMYGVAPGDPPLLVRTKCNPPNSLARRRIPALDSC